MALKKQREVVYSPIATQFLMCSMAQDETHQLRSAKFEVPFSWSPTWPLCGLASLIWPLLWPWVPYRPLWSLIKHYKFNCGSHPVPIPIDRTNEKLPYGNSLFVELHRLSPSVKLLEALLKAFQNTF